MDALSNPSSWCSSLSNSLIGFHCDSLSKKETTTPSMKLFARGAFTDVLINGKTIAEANKDCTLLPPKYN